MFDTSSCENSAPKNQRTPYLDAIKLLAKRDYSRVKLKKKLLEKDHPEDEIESALTTLEEEGYLQEEMYIDARIRGFMNKGWAPLAIKRKLATEDLDVSLSLIESVFTREGIKKNQQIQWILAKRTPSELPSASDPEGWEKLKNRFLRNLASKGHEPQMCFEAVNSLLDRLKDTRS